MSDRLLDLIGPRDGRYLAGGLPAGVPVAELDELNAGRFAAFACDDCTYWRPCGGHTRTRKPCFSCGGEVHRREMALCPRCGDAVRVYELRDHLTECEA